jgi:hypothetical protein
MFDPTAPLPSLWPSGAWGVFLIFATQIGAGIPLGVLRARDAGLSLLETAGLYFASDLVLAVTVEPMLAGLRWLGQRVELLGRLGKILGRLTGGAGLQEGGVRGPLGLILVSFSVSPAFGRAASEAAGYGFFLGWALAIIGDMAYFLLVAASTLWVSSVFKDDRLAIGAVLVGTWVLPVLIRRYRNRGKPSKRMPRREAPVRLASSPAVVVPATASVPSLPSAPRKRATQNGRRRPSRGLHR